MPTPNFDFDYLDNALTNAPVAGFGPRSVFGKCTIDVEILRWEGEKPRKLVRRPLKKGDVADQSKGEYLQVNFHIDVQELNPAMSKEWKRQVDAKRSNKTNKDQSKWTLTDWSEIVLPSLQKTLGKDFSKQLAKGVYVEVEEVTTVEVDYKTGDLKGWNSKEPDPITGETKHFTNSVPAFVRAFKSKAECLAAYQEKYKKSDDDLSFGDDEVSIPAKAISDVSGVLKAVEDHDTVIQIVSTTYGNYDLVALLTAAGASPELLEAATASVE